VVAAVCDAVVAVVMVVAAVCDAVVAVVMVVAAMCDHAGANAGEVRSNGGGRQEANAPLLIGRVQ
jgi:hypothetical protein